MPASFLSLLPPQLQKHAASLCRAAAGFAEDFWYDGNWKPPAYTEPAPRRRAAAPMPPLPAGSGWHAEAGEIAERMWGRGIILPGDTELTESLAAPLGLAKDMSLLDLSAGLGMRAAHLGAIAGLTVTGLEADAEIAARAAATGAEITPFDPDTLATPHQYDCVVMRELVYRAADREAFVKRVAACCKTKAQVSFTDYIVNPEIRDRPALAAWRAAEPQANPPSLMEMAEFWARQGFNLGTHDDQTEFYKKEVMQGLARFAEFAAAAHPDAETRRRLNARLTPWMHRLAAIGQGMKFYRFYGVR